MTKQTAFHDSFAKHTRNFIEYNGYWLANCFAEAGPIEEYTACRQAAVMMDLSPLRQVRDHRAGCRSAVPVCLYPQYEDAGRGRRSFIRRCATEHGGMIDDGTVFRLGRDNFPLDRGQ